MIKPVKRSQRAPGRDIKATIPEPAEQARSRLHSRCGFDQDLALRPAHDLRDAPWPSGRQWHALPVSTSDLAGAVFFDVDGTLVPGTTSTVFLAGFLGHREELAEAEDAYSAGVLDNRHVSELDAAGWAGASEERVRGWLDGLPLVPGIAETVAWCWSNGLVPVLATLAWTTVGSYLADRFGFHSFSGPRLETAGGRFTGRVARHFDEYDKRDFALAEARELGLGPRFCGAVGDSRSDLPLFAAVRLSVAFNATAGAKSAATVTVDGHDLQGVLPALSQLIAATESFSS